MNTRIITLLTTLAISSFSMAQIINVPADQPSIQAGIDSALDGYTVLVDTGTYEENINFNGKAITVASKFIMDGDTNHINNTVIDGSQPANPDNGSVVTFSSSEDSTSVLCGFTITGGTGTYISSYDQKYGGGIYCNNAGAKIIHNKIINNTSIHTGDACGGGIGCRFGSSWIVIRDNVIRDNIVSSDNDALGGGIYSRYNYMIINNSLISHNSLSGNNTYGGAICISYTYHTEMTGNIITRNEVNNITYYWLGVYFFTPKGPLNIIQNEFSYNEGEHTNWGGAGGLGVQFAYAYPVNIDGNRFLHNSAYEGGGFYMMNSYNLSLTNNVFIGNDAYYGGAIGVYHGEGPSDEHRPQFINNTFFSNSASATGGAIGNYADYIDAPPVIMNCIFWGNTAPTGKDIRNWTSDTLSVYYSNIDYYNIFGKWHGGFNFFANPELNTDSIHLLENSPCLDTGIDSLEINGTTYYCPFTDIDGEERPMAMSRPDIGADEWYPDTGYPDLVYRGSIFKIYPNPASNNFSVDVHPGMEVDAIEIINIQGKLVLYQNVINNNLSFNVSDFPHGLYIVRIQSSNAVLVKKLIIH